jgi:hypothetical protein
MKTKIGADLNHTGSKECLLQPAWLHELQIFMSTYTLNLGYW